MESINESAVHLRHCYQGEYEDSCKYGEEDCPAKPKKETKNPFATDYFVDYELVNSLTLKGFYQYLKNEKEPVFGYYIKDFLTQDITAIPSSVSLGYLAENYCGILIAAPIYQQIFNWLSKVHKIVLIPDYTYYDGVWWGYKYFKSNGDSGQIWINNDGNTPDGSSSLEEATTFAIKKLLYDIEYEETN